MKINVAALEDLYQVLSSLEWEPYEASNQEPVRICPVCGQHQFNGHDPACRLAQALRKARADS